MNQSTNQPINQLTN